jgi:hydrogenase-4 component H
MVMLNPDLCTHGAQCVTACPTDAITLTDDAEQMGPTKSEAGRTRWEVDHAKCLFCGLCQEVCPTGAITLGNKDRLAVKHKDDLRVSVTFTSPEAKKGP